MFNDANASVKLAEREMLVQMQPCFSMMTEDECRELAKLMTGVTFSSGQAIVVQDAVVDKVFIIVDGHAEVSQRSNKTPSSSVPLAVLGPGEAIGLSEKGLFSATGKRTATVTALTAIKALALDVDKLNVFFDKYAHIPVEILASADKMLQVHFIKQALAFENLSQEKMTWLASHIEDVFYHAGDVIFKQGDSGDRCYLIFSGKVEITRQDEHGIDHLLAVLTAPAFFGEATLITGAPRNATARMQEDGELLVLQHQYLSELMETENLVSNKVMRAMVERSRPKQSSHVIPFQRKTADGQDVIILKNPDNNKYCQISPADWKIWRQLNGKQALSTLQDDSSLEARVELVSKLAQDDFVELNN